MQKNNFIELFNLFDLQAIDLGASLEQNSMHFNTRSVTGANTVDFVTNSICIPRQLRAFRTPASRTSVITWAQENSGLTSNSSLLGPSLNLGGPALGPKLATSNAKPELTLDDVPLESGVSPRARSFAQCTHGRPSHVHLSFSFFLLHSAGRSGL